MTAQAKDKLSMLLYKYHITHEMLANHLGINRATVSNKIKSKSFTQKELINLLEYLQSYDRTIDEKIFFN